MKNVGIHSVGYYVPQRVLTNEHLEQMIETSDDWIWTRTGIKERRVAAKGERTSHLAIEAARHTLEKGKFDPFDIELIIVATASPDSCFPSMACLVQQAIGAKKAAAFDVSAACAGYLYAITTAKKFIQSGMYKNALVIAAEKFTSLIDWNDRTTCVLFGDGAGGCILTERDVAEGGILSDYLHAIGDCSNFMYGVVEETEPLSQDQTTMNKPYVVMHGKELFKIAVNSMADAVKIAVKDAGLQLSDIDMVVPHQANDRIISAVAKKLGVPKEEFYINIHRYGNMSAASIAVALYEAVNEGRIKKGMNVALVAFGAGLVSAANVVKW